MTTLTLTEDLLTLLEAVKAKQKLAIIETHFDNFPSNYAKEIRNYFYAFPEELIHGLGLKRNERCIRAIESLTIPDQWLNTEYDQLNQFTFSY